VPSAPVPSVVPVPSAPLPRMLPDDAVLAPVPLLPRPVGLARTLELARMPDAAPLAVGVGEGDAYAEPPSVLLLLPLSVADSVPLVAAPVMPDPAAKLPLMVPPPKPMPPPAAPPCAAASSERPVPVSAPVSAAAAAASGDTPRAQPPALSLQPMGAPRL